MRKILILGIALIVMLLSCATNSVPEDRTMNSVKASDSAEAAVEDNLDDSNQGVDYFFDNLPDPVVYDGIMKIEILNLDGVLSRDYSDIKLKVKMTNLTGNVIEAIAYQSVIRGGQTKFDLDKSLRLIKVNIPPGESYIREYNLNLDKVNDEMFNNSALRSYGYSNGLELKETVFYKKANGSLAGYGIRMPDLPVIPVDLQAAFGHESIMKSVLDNDVPLTLERLKEGDNVNTCDAKGNTLLFKAISNNNIEMVEALIANGADPNLTNRVNENALSMALKGGDLPIIDMILNNGGVYNEGYMFSGFQWAVEQKNWNLVQQLLEAGATPESFGLFVEGNRTDRISLLQWATLNNDKELIDKMVSFGASPSVIPEIRRGMFAYMTPLHIAADRGNAALVEYYLTLGADVNTVDECSISPLMAASHYGNLNIVKMLVEAGADVTYSRTDEARGLVGLFDKKQGRGISLRDCIFYVAQDHSYSFNSLSIASYLGHEDIVEYLISEGADVNQVFKWGSKEYTALDLAEMSKQNSAIDILKAAGGKSLLSES